MNIRTLTSLLAISLAALGCAAKTMDLDAPVIEPSAEPDVLGTLPEVLTKLVVDDERLYWIGVGRPRSFIQSCQKQDCAATLVTYDVQPWGIDKVLAARGGEVYWYRASTGELLSCPRGGCNGSPRRVATKLTASNEVGASAFDDDRFYFTDPTQSDGTTIFSVSLTQPGPRRFVASSRSAQVVGLDDTYAYWSSDGDTQLSRARKDGTSVAEETVATDVKYGYPQGFAFGTDQTAIYWTNNALAGSINRCPVAGCSGASEMVTGPVRAPQNLLIDDSDLYYVYETQSGKLALATCELPACAQSTTLTLAEGLFKADLLTLDDQYLYLATSEQEWISLEPEDELRVNIRRVPKPNGGQR